MLTALDKVPIANASFYSIKKRSNNPIKTLAADFCELQKFADCGNYRKFAKKG